MRIWVIVEAWSMVPMHISRTSRRRAALLRRGLHLFGDGEWKQVVAREDAMRFTAGLRFATISASGSVSVSLGVNVPNRYL